MVDIVAIKDGCGFKTTNLSSKYGYEIVATISSKERLVACEDFIGRMVSYTLSGNKINPGETVAYGYWLTKAIADENGNLIFHEYNPEATDFIPGIDNTLFYWQEQHYICDRAGSQFFPPRPDQMVVISEGVYEGEAVEGIRYPSPSHMSGWWMITDRYDGDIKSLKSVHAYHVSSKRPDLAQFLALPYGYRFLSAEAQVWFDEEVASADS